MTPPTISPPHPTMDRFIDDLFGIGPELRAIMIVQLVTLRERKVGVDELQMLPL